MLHVAGSGMAGMLCGIADVYRVIVGYRQFAGVGWYTMYGRVAIAVVASSGVSVR